MQYAKFRVKSADDWDQPKSKAMWQSAWHLYRECNTFSAYFAANHAAIVVASASGQLTHANVECPSPPPLSVSEEMGLCSFLEGAGGSGMCATYLSTMPLQGLPTDSVVAVLRAELWMSFPLPGFPQCLSTVYC